MIEQELGKKMMPEELAVILGINVKTVRQYYQKLGGIRLGSRYIFFERRVIDAISKEWDMESPSEDEWKEEGEVIQDEEGCHRLGKQNAKLSGRVGRTDRYNLLD